MDNKTIAMTSILCIVMGFAVLQDFSEPAKAIIGTMGVLSGFGLIAFMEKT